VGTEGSGVGVAGWAVAAAGADQLGLAGAAADGAAAAGVTGGTETGVVLGGTEAAFARRVRPIRRSRMMLATTRTKKSSTTATAS
jgi:hypothetical protein